MKRRLAALLAVLTLLGGGALAAEETPSLYEKMGPYYAWSEEQCAEAQGWNEETWFTYWDEYDDAVSGQYWADYEAWGSAYYGDLYDPGSPYDPDGEWEAYIEEIRAGLDLPYKTGINLSLNGEYLRFDGVQPMAVSGRTMVPFRAFLEHLGARVDFEDGHITAALPRRTLEMDLGGRTLTVTENGAATRIAMDAAPFAQAGRTYIPARFAAEALGLDVTWDGACRLVHLTDWDAAQAALDSRFTSLNAVLAGLRACLDPEKTYASRQNTALSGTLYGESKNDTAVLSLSGSSLISRAGLSGEYTLNLDPGGLREPLAALLSEETMAAAERLSGTEVNLIVNARTGMTYLKSSRMSALTGGSVPDGTWVSSEGYAPASGFALSEALPAGMGTLLTTSFREPWYDDADWSRLHTGQSPWEVCMAEAAAYEALLGDGAFTVSGGSEKTYTLSPSAAALNAWAEEAGLAGADESESLSGLSLRGVFRLSGGKVTGLDLAAGCRLKGALPLEISFRTSGSPASLRTAIDVKGAYAGRLTLTQTNETQVTGQSVPAAPPAGEEIIPLGDGAVPLSGIELLLLNAGV